MLMTCGIVEVAQQSKARRKDDFLVAFSPVIAEATACAYRGATNEVQQKLRRVVEVWRARIYLANGTHIQLLGAYNSITRKDFYIAGKHED